MKPIRYAVCFLLVLPVYGQKVKLITQVEETLRTVNGGRGPALPGTSIPPTCTVGDLFFKTNATAGQNEYGCTATNTWTLQSGSGSSALKTTNSQTGTTYTYQNSDCSSVTSAPKLVKHSNASPIAGTLPQANGSTFVDGCVIDVLNVGAGALTITPTISTFQTGATSIILYTGQSARIISDGTNYAASGVFVLCATCAGSIEMAAGTAPTIVANTVTRYAPTSVTGYTLRELAAACTGILLVTNTANDMVPTCLSSTGTGTVVRSDGSVINNLTLTGTCTGCYPAALLIKPCQIVIGSVGTGSTALSNDNDAPAVCKNDTGATLTITEVKCYADSSTGTPSVLPKITGGSDLLTGAIACGNAVYGSAGTLNGTPTQSSGATIDANISTAGGTAKYIIIDIIRTL